MCSCFTDLHILPHIDDNDHDRDDGEDGDDGDDASGENLPASTPNIPPAKGRNDHAINLYYILRILIPKQTFSHHDAHKNHRATRSRSSQAPSAVMRRHLLQSVRVHCLTQRRPNSRRRGRRHRVPLRGKGVQNPLHPHPAQARNLGHPAKARSPLVRKRRLRSGSRRVVRTRSSSFPPSSYLRFKLLLGLTIFPAHSFIIIVVSCVITLSEKN